MDQCGFGAGKLCMGHMLYFKQIIDKRIATWKKLHLLFIDLSKAYNSILLIKLWKALKYTLISHAMITAIKQTYKDSTVKIKLDQRLQMIQHHKRPKERLLCLATPI